MATKAGSLRVELLGTFRVYRSSQLLEEKDWIDRKVQALFEILLSERGRSFSQDELIESLWPDLSPEQGLNNLRVRVSQLRKLLEPGLKQGQDSRYILTAHEGYRFNSKAECSVDTENFARRCQQAEALEAKGRFSEAITAYGSALQIYRGDLLEENKYDEWTIPHRERWRELFLTALAHLAECHARLGQYPRALEYCRRALEKDSLREGVYRQQMLYQFLSGEAGAAVQTYEQCVKLLKEQLGVEPARETQELYQKISKGEVTSFKEVYPTPEVQTLVKHNLPQSLTSFIGRERELMQTKQLITDVGAQHAAPLHRLVTLTGSGGCGKTRLALQLGLTLLKDYPHGIWLVELAALTDPALVPQTVANVLGVKEEKGRSIVQTLTEYLRTKNLLLVLDNCEHVIAACAQLAETLLQACPDMQILATSREALGVAGETIWRVPSLLVPDIENLEVSLKPAPQNREPSEKLPALKVLQQYEAVALFIERALSHQPKFELTPKNASAIVQICRHLDGMPLAIELAAARLKVLTVEQIAARLDDRFKLLTGGTRTALPRQQTLRAAIDWSYELLSEPERVMLHRLSVFSGGWTLEAAERVCVGEALTLAFGHPSPAQAGEGSGTSIARVSREEIESEGLAESDVLDLLTHLVDKSLVVVDQQGEEARYRMLETVRQYAHEKLRESGELESVQERHRDFFLALAEKAEPELMSKSQKLWLDRFEVEHSNFRAALEWNVTENDDADLKARLVGVLWRFWQLHGYFSEGRKWVEEVLSTNESVSALIRAKVFQGAGTLTWSQGDYAAARSFYEQSLTIRKSTGDKQGIASLLNNLGSVAYTQGDYKSAHMLYEESLIISREVGNQQAVANASSNLGVIAYSQSDYDKARSFFEESLIIRQKIGDSHGIALSLLNLGNVALDQGDLISARSYYEKSLLIFRELGNKQLIANLLSNLGNLVANQENYEDACPYLEESLNIRKELGDKQGIATSLHNLGEVARKQKDYVEARTLYKESLSIRQELGEKRGVASSLEKLGMVSLEEGDYIPAHSLYKQSLAIRQELGDKPGIALCLEGLADIACQRKEFKEAARLLGAAESLREVINAPLSPADRADYDCYVDTVKAGLGEVVFSEVWAGGRATKIDHLVNDILRDSS